jgi:hypothetical protein
MTSRKRAQGCAPTIVCVALTVEGSDPVSPGVLQQIRHAERGLTGQEPGVHVPETGLLAGAVGGFGRLEGLRDIDNRRTRSGSALAVGSPLNGAPSEGLEVVGGLRGSGLGGRSVGHGFLLALLALLPDRDAAVTSATKGDDVEEPVAIQIRQRDAVHDR